MEATARVGREQENNWDAVTHFHSKIRRNRWSESLATLCDVSESSLYLAELEYGFLELNAAAELDDQWT